MIKIFTFASNRTDFLGLQLYSFRKYLKEDFEFVAFNNAQFDLTGYGANYHDIHIAGHEIGIPIIDIEKDQTLINYCQSIESSCSLFNNKGQYSNANVAHAYALCWAWQNIISKEKNAIAIFDSDVFLIQSIKLTDSLKSYPLRGILDGRRHPQTEEVFHYIWPTFVLADLSRLPASNNMNWWCGKIKDVSVDVGGQNYHYFQNYNLDINQIKIDYKHLEDNSACLFHPSNYDEFYLKDATILHYRSGSNWNHQTSDFHRIKTEWLKQRLESGQ